MISHLGRCYVWDPCDEGKGTLRNDRKLKGLPSAPTHNFQVHAQLSCMPQRVWDPCDEAKGAPTLFSASLSGADMNYAKADQGYQ